MSEKALCEMRASDFCVGIPDRTNFAISLYRNTNKNTGYGIFYDERRLKAWRQSQG